MAFYNSINTAFIIGVSALVLLFASDVIQHNLPPEPAPEGISTQYPIVLMHGLLGAPVSMRQIEKSLIQAGHQTFTTSAPPLHDIKTRSELIAKQLDIILTVTDSQKVNIIAHSMGGLDARYLISKMGYGDKIASLTTVSTPHRGMPLAPLVLTITGRVHQENLSELGRQIGRELTIPAMANEVNVHAGFHNLTSEQMTLFNANMSDDDRVYYQSWAGLSKIGGHPSIQDKSVCERIWGKSNIRDTMNFSVSASAWLTLKGNQHPSDGIVPVISAKWGNFRGCIHADHLDVLGIRAPDRQSGFDFQSFYRGLVVELSRMGY
jgi:triacylglycerol lipase